MDSTIKKIAEWANEPTKHDVGKDIWNDRRGRME